jgi:hypothetical protein
LARGGFSSHVGALHLSLPVVHLQFKIPSLCPPTPSRSHVEILQFHVVLP